MGENLLDHDLHRLLIAGQHCPEDAAYLQGLAGQKTEPPAEMTFIQKCYWWSQYRKGAEDARPGGLR